MVLIVGPT